MKPKLYLETTIPRPPFRATWLGGQAGTYWLPPISR